MSDMFIIEWLTDYMSTPKMDMTPEIEMLGLLAIGIISFGVIGVIWLVGLIVGKIIKSKKGGESE